MHRCNQTKPSSPRKVCVSSAFKEHGRLDRKAGLKARRVVNTDHVLLAQISCAPRLHMHMRNDRYLVLEKLIANVLFLLSAAGFNRCNVHYIHKLLYHVERSLIISARD